MNKKQLRIILKKSELGKALWQIMHKANITINRLYSDEQYFSKKYAKVHGKKLDFDNPKTFDEKQLWIKCFYRNPKYTLCSDKFLVQEYVKNKGLGYILNPIIATYKSTEDIEWDKLPNSFYMKANHFSGGNIRCNDLNTFDKKAAIKKLKRALKTNYYYESREWNYKDIEPRIIVEDILESKSGEGLIDYRFFCYNGKCEYLFIDIDTAGDSGEHRADAKRNVYDRDMNLLDVFVSRPHFDADLVKKPNEFEEMRDIAETLSSDFAFCRVDLYNIDGRIVFGEITFFHAGGLSNIEPEEWEYKLGEHIDIDSLKTEMKQKNS